MTLLTFLVGVVVGVLMGIAACFMWKLRDPGDGE